MPFWWVLSVFNFFMKHTMTNPACGTGTALSEFSANHVNASTICAALGISKPTWHTGVKAGRYPPPFYLSPRRPMWRKADIETLIKTL
jgi:predicted DNA-binding transcriptional regulator AlpA